MVLTAKRLSLFFVPGFLIVLLLPLTMWGQKWKVNEYDKLTKKWSMETFPLNLKSAENAKMDVALKYTDTAYLMRLTGSGIGTNTLDAGSELLLQLDSGITITLKSPSVQTIDYGNLLPTYKHDYVVSFDNLNRLSRYNVQSLRKYSIGGFDDFTIEKKNAGVLKQLSVLFLGQLATAKLLPVKSSSVLAAFPGGKEVLANFLNRNLKPLTELQNGERKNLVFEFKVTADGSINNLQVKDAANAALEEELLRILKRMPKWKPASEDGRPVSSIVTHTVTFYRTNESLKIQLDG